METTLEIHPDSDEIKKMGRELFGDTLTPDITERQRQWIELVYKGVHPTQAARQLGYKCPRQTAHHLKNSPTMKEYNQKLLEVIGIPDILLGLTIKNALFATRAVEVVVTDNTEETREREQAGKFRSKRKEIVREDDHYARLQATDMALKLRGLYPEKTTNVNVSGSLDVRNAPHVTINMLTLEGSDLVDALMSRSRQIANGTLPKEEVGQLEATPEAEDVDFWSAESDSAWEEMP